MNRAFENVDTKNSQTLQALYPLCPRRQITLFAICTLLAGGQCYGAISQSDALINLSLEELGDLHVTSVSKKEQRLADAAAAVYVITEDAIRRAGVLTLPEALRLAPNLLVAQINANTYAISARGFNSSTANKLLVMIDGRTIYTPLYSGVFWDVQDVMLEDVDRIEVISGPGGTLWGANAVNGVINIITKRANTTDGNLISAAGGNAGRSIAVRHGGSLSDNGGAYRLYAKADQGRHTVRADGSAVQDAWDRSQVGFRADWRDLTVQGDAYRGSVDQSAPGQQVNSGANLLVRWNKSQADGSGLRVQSYVDHTSRAIPGTFSESLNTFDLDVQYSLPNEGGKQTIWGGGYRVSDDQVGNTAALAFLPAQRKLHWANLFVQQERTLSPSVRLTVGGKLETNDYTGLEFLPSLKLAWKPADEKLLWAGLSRAVRAPSRIDAELYAPGKPPYLLVGNPDFQSEIANTLELGWRAQEGQTLSYSLVLFHSEYDHLRSLDRLPGGVFALGNQIKGRVDGLETWSSYQATKAWSFDASVLLLHERFSGANLAQSSPGNDPRSQWTLGAKWNISDNQQLDVRLRRVGELRSPEVPAYTSVDARFGWRLSKGVELAVTGRNLFNPRHQEFASGSGSLAANPIQIERAIDIALTARF